MNAKSTARTPEREQWFNGGLDRFSDKEGWQIVVETRNSDGTFKDIVCRVDSELESNREEDHVAALALADQIVADHNAPWQAGREGLLEALRLADELVRTDGHTLTPPCKFGGCTCGGIEAYKVARSNYVRARREALLGFGQESTGQVKLTRAEFERFVRFYERGQKATKRG